MKLKKYIYGVVLGALALNCASCYNADHEFPDFEGGTILSCELTILAWLM